MSDTVGEDGKLTYFGALKFKWRDKTFQTILIFYTFVA